MANASSTIVHYLYEPGDGGLDRVAILIANAMAAQGQDCELWMTRADGPVAHLISPDLRVRIVPAPRIGGRGMRLALQIPALARMIGEVQPAAILSAGNQSNLTIALARNLSRHKATKVIQKVTNPIARPGMKPLTIKLRHWRFGRTFKLADLVLTLSEDDARQLGQSFPAMAGKFAPVKNAYVTDAMLMLGESRIVRPAELEPRLLAVGRIAVQKDYATMLQALAQLRHLPWRLEVLGDGPLMPQMRALAAQLHIAERVYFRGFVSDPAPRYAAADLLVLSSRWEGFPAVPLEAMAAGCDVVATDCSAGLSAILNRLGRSPVPVGNAAALAGTIALALEHPQPSAALHEAARDYSIASATADHLRLIGGITA